MKQMSFHENLDAFNVVSTLISSWSAFIVPILFWRKILHLTNKNISVWIGHTL